MTDTMTSLSTQPEAPQPAGLGVTGWARWTWRQLTSMRTALFLLFLLAVAAIPGGIIPQRAQNPVAVREWIDARPTLGPWFDRLWLFDVYGSPWFAAIYLLLMLSLVGCIVPRVRQHWKALRMPPPLTPRNLGRLPSYLSFESAQAPDEVLDRAAGSLRGWRVDRRSDSVAAERGYLREVGNLVFHIALLVLLVGVAMGALWGVKGSAIVVEGKGFANTPARFDVLTPGRLASSVDMPPFSFDLKDFRATYEESGPQRGAPRTFEADVLVRTSPEDEDPHEQTIRVNEPLNVDGTKVFLIGHGYAVHVIVRDGAGTVVFDDAVPFLPQDGAFTSTGVVKVPDAEPTQLGFDAIFLPTAVVDPERGPISTFPAAENPALYFSAWTGDLGLDRGLAQSVYKLDVSQLERVGISALTPGETYDLPNGAGSITFVGVSEYATVQVASTPGKLVSLGAVIAAIAGVLVSLFTRRRRVWVRTTPHPGGTLVEVGGLGRSEHTDISSDVYELAERLGAPVPEPRKDASS